jgi:SAM-dependent methyltransferase
MFSGENMHYNQDYFNWQKNIGAFGGYANYFKFSKYISQSDNVVDFGCGGGFLLKQIDCRGKIGIEINDVAREDALNNEINAVKCPTEVPDNFADVIISNHALEHVESPLEILKELYPKLKEDGHIVFVVPHQKPNEKFIEGDINNHLYTWNPLTLGNLFKEAGFKIKKVDLIYHTWPPYYTKIASIFGLNIFNVICRIYASLKRTCQVRVVATK